MSVQSDVLHQVRSILGIKSEWIENFPGGFTWWPGGIRQEIGRRPDALPYDERFSVVTRLGKSGSSGRGHYSLTGPIKDSVLSAVTTFGQPPGVAALASAFEVSGHELCASDNIDVTARTLAMAAASQLKTVLRCFNQGWVSDEPTLPRPAVPQSMVDRALTLVSPQIMNRSTRNEGLDYLQSDLRSFGLTMSSSCQGLVATGLVPTCGSVLWCVFSVDALAVHPLFGPGVSLNITFPRLVPAVPPASAAAALTDLALADPVGPSVAGVWHPEYRLRHSLFVPAGLIEKATDFRYFGVWLLCQGRFLQSAVVNREPAEPRLWRWFSRVSPNSRDYPAASMCGTAAVPTVLSGRSDGPVPDDAEEVARVLLSTVPDGVPVIQQYLLAREDDSDSRWVLWSRLFDDSLLNPIGADPQDRPLATCAAKEVDGQAAAEALLRFAWNRESLKGHFRFRGARSPIRAGSLLPPAVIEGLFATWNANRSAA